MRPTARASCVDRNEKSEEKRSADVEKLSRAPKNTKWDTCMFVEYILRKWYHMLFYIVMSYAPKYSEYIFACVHA